MSWEQSWTCCASPLYTCSPRNQTFSSTIFPLLQVYYYFDDDETSRETEDAVLSEHSYVLFLVRKQPPGWQIPRQRFEDPDTWPHTLTSEQKQIFPEVFKLLAENAERANRKGDS